MAKKLTAKQIVQDIKAGMSDEDLIAKYNLSAQLLPRLFHKLISMNAITKEDIISRRRGVQIVEAPTEDLSTDRQYAPTQLMEPEPPPPPDTAAPPPQEPPGSPPEPRRPTEKGVDHVYEARPPVRSQPPPGPAVRPERDNSPLAALRRDLMDLAERYRFSREDLLRLQDRYGLSPHEVENLLRRQAEEAQERTFDAEPYREETQAEVEAEVVSSDYDEKPLDRQEPEEVRVVEERKPPVRPAVEEKPRKGVLGAIGFPIKLVLYLIVLAVFVVSLAWLVSGARVDILSDLQQLRTTDLGTRGKTLAFQGADKERILKAGGPAAERCAKKFSSDPNLAPAMGAAIRYGPAGMALLERVGPRAFLDHIRLKDRLDRMAGLAGIQTPLAAALGQARTLPPWFPIVIAGVTGAVVLGVPLIWLFRRRRKH